MCVVCPTVTAYTNDEFNEQLNTLEPFAERIHFDVGDGEFTTKMIDIADMRMPAAAIIDVHLMAHNPERYLPELIALQPALVIAHAEARGDVLGFMKHLREHGIASGIALLQKTQVNDVRPLIKQADHVLIFSGSLGSFGGKVDFSLLRKVVEAKAIKPHAEIGWDGGINAGTIRQLANGGVDVLNVGGAIQKATRPANAYQELRRLLQD